MVFQGAVVVSLACTHPDAPSIDYHDVLSPVPVLGGCWVSQGVQSSPSVVLVGHHRTGSVVPHTEKSDSMIKSCLVHN